MTDPRFTFQIMGPIQLLNGDHRGAKILDSIPEFQEIRDSYENTNRRAELPEKFDLDAAAQRFREGGDLEEIAREAATRTTEYRTLHEATGAVMSRAESMHDSDVLSFFQQHRKVLAAGVLAEYEAIKAAAIAPVKQLGNRTDQAEILDHPELWDAWKLFNDLVAELKAWSTTQRRLVGRDNSGLSGKWPFVDMLADYERAWPNFQRTEAQTEYRNEITRYRVPAEPAPWDSFEDMLRDVARRDLNFWSPTEEELSKEISRLETVGSARRAADMRDVITPRQSGSAHNPFAPRDFM